MTEFSQEQEVKQDEGFKIPDNLEEIGSAPVEGNEEPLSEVAALAASYGWKADGERTAEEYIKYALEKLPKRGKELDTMRRTIDELKAHMEKQESAAYQKALNDLATQRVEAIKQGDPNLVQQIEQAQADLVPQKRSQDALDFEARNADWFTSPKFEHRQMKKWLLEEDLALAAYNLSPSEHIAELERGLHIKFNDYFQKQNRGEEIEEEKPAKVSRVESGYNNGVANPRGVKKKYTFNDLSADQKQIARDFERGKIMTVEKYINDLIKHGEL